MRWSGCAGNRGGPSSGSAGEGASQVEQAQPKPGCHKFTPRPTSTFLCLYCIFCPTDGADFLEVSAADQQLDSGLCFICVQGTGEFWPEKEPLAIVSTQHG